MITVINKILAIDITQNDVPENYHDFTISSFDRDNKLVSIKFDLNDDEGEERLTTSIRIVLPGSDLIQAILNAMNNNAPEPINSGVLRSGIAR